MIRTIALIALSLIASQAHAQETAGGIDAHGFQLVAPTPDARDLLSVQRPRQMSSGDWFAGGLFEYAKAPLVAILPDGEKLQVVDNLVGLNLAGGGVVHERVRLDLSAPLYLSSVGLDGSGSTALGDVRLGGMVVALTEDDTDGLLTVGIVPWLDLPTGPDERFLGQAGIAGGMLAAASTQVDTLTFTGNLGMQFNSALAQANLTGSDTLLAALGAGTLVGDELGVNVELRGALPLVANEASGTGAPWEGLLSGRYTTAGGGQVLGGLAAGLSAGVGAPAFRIFVGGGFGSVKEVSDAPMEAVVSTPDPAQPVAPEAVYRLTVVAELDGVRVEDVRVDIDGLEQHQVTTTGVIEVADSTLWKAIGQRGVCLEGEGFARVDGADANLVVILQKMLGAKLSVIVMNADGAPVPHATVRVESKDVGCSPRGELTLDSAGMANAEIGVGSHKVIIEAEGHLTHEEVVNLQMAGSAEVVGLLMPVEEELGAED